jgi:hypothetical protein
VKKLRRYDHYLYWFYAFEKNNLLMDVYVRTASGGLINVSSPNCPSFTSGDTRLQHAVITNVFVAFPTYNGSRHKNIMSSPQDALNIATATAASVQALVAALQQHTLQPALQT